MRPALGGVATAAAALAALLSSGCATSSAFRAGETAERRQDYDKAVLEYSKALKESPNNLDYRKSLERARLRASQEHTTSGRRLVARGLCNLGCFAQPWDTQLRWQCGIPQQAGINFLRRRQRLCALQ